MVKLYHTRDTVTGRKITMPYYVEYAKSSRVACTKCHGKIGKGSIKIGVMPPGIDTLVWRHLGCVTHRHATNVFNYYMGNLDKMEGRENITDSDWTSVVKTYKEALTTYDFRAKKWSIPTMKGLPGTTRPVKKAKKQQMEEQKVEKKESPWITHVREYMNTHKCTWSEALKGAKATYTPVAKRVSFLEEEEKTPMQTTEGKYEQTAEHIEKAGTGGLGKRSNPWMLHVAYYMKEHQCNLKQALIGAKQTYTKMEHEPGLSIEPRPYHPAAMEVDVDVIMEVEAETAGAAAFAA